MENKKTLVIGASPNTERTSNLAVKRLIANGHQVIAMGNKPGLIGNAVITTEVLYHPDIDTVTLYLNARRQKDYYDYILSLHPRRVIFNPGAENDELLQLAREKGIKTLEACTLVMLSTGQY